MNKIVKQQENINTLIELAKANPELEIVPMVATECVQGDDFAYWMAEWGTPKVDEYYCSDERIYFKSQDYERLVEEVIDNYDEDVHAPYEEIESMAKMKVNGYEWVKAIVVYIKEL